MATKRPPSSDPEEVPDNKRHCSKGSVSVTLSSVGSPVPATCSPVSLVIQSAPLVHSPVRYVPPLQAGPITVQQGGTDSLLPPDYGTPRSSVLVLATSSPNVYSPSTSTTLPLSSSASVLTGTASGNRQPVCSVDLKPASKIQSSVKIRTKILKNRRAKLTAIKLKYEAMLKEKFFLENGGNMMEYVAWKKKPNYLRDEYLKNYSIESGNSPIAGSSLQPPTVVGSTLTSTSASLKPSEATVSLGVTSTVNTSTGEDSLATSQPQIEAPLPAKPLSLDVSAAPPSATTVQIPLSTVSPGLHVTPTKGLTPISPSRSISFPSTSPRPATRAHASFSSVYENSHEDIVMRARQEAEVMKSISELRKEGLWSASRLPKVCEPVRIKTHWDYLLEEMQWLATDFANEKRWKINAARKVMIVVEYITCCNMLL